MAFSKMAWLALLALQAATVYSHSHVTAELDMPNQLELGDSETVVTVTFTNTGERPVCINKITGTLKFNGTTVNQVKHEKPYPIRAGEAVAVKYPLRSIPFLELDALPATARLHLQARVREQDGATYSIEITRRDVQIILCTPEEVMRIAESRAQQGQPPPNYSQCIWQ